MVPQEITSKCVKINYYYLPCLVIYIMYQSNNNSIKIYKQLLSINKCDTDDLSITNKNVCFVKGVELLKL